MGTTTASVEAYKINRVGAASGLLMSPKQIGRDDAERADIVAFAIRLMGHGVSASDVATERIPAEFPGTTVSISTVAGWARGVKIKLGQGGRPLGSKESEQRAPRVDIDYDLRERATAALERYGSLRKAGAAIGLSGERVRQLVKSSASK